MTEPNIMPHFVDALEGRLRAEAIKRGATKRSLSGIAGPSWRPVLLAAALVAAAATAIALVPLTGTSERALANSIALLRTPALEIDRDTHMREIASGLSSELDRAWSAPAFGGTAYLMSGDGIWCLSAPDAATKQPDLERGSTCTDDSTFARLGLSLTIGNDYVAVLPDAAPPPSLRGPDGAQRRLSRSQRGVVVLQNVPPGSSITLYDDKGGSRTDTIRRTGSDDGLKSWKCADGSYYRSPPGVRNPCLTDRSSR
jgi:hypothetical protein